MLCPSCSMVQAMMALPKSCDAGIYTMTILIHECAGCRPPRNLSRASHRSRG